MVNDESLHILVMLEATDQRISIAEEFYALGMDASTNCRVSFRSIDIPLDRLLLEDCIINQQQACLVVVWGATTTPLMDVLKQSLPCPVVAIEKKDEAISTAVLTVAKFASLFSDSVRARVHRRVEALRQAALVEDSRLKVESYQPEIAECFDANRQILGDSIHLGTGLFKRYRGKVRDRWESEEICVLITTDRQSGFDRQLAVVPFKGAVLNLCSQFWFQKTVDIIPNHLISVPHPSVAIVKRCQPFPIEFVVRSYMTGSTDTSIWKNYQNGVRLYCGHELPEGMTKNQKLPNILLTPTTKEEDHDRPISLSDIVKEGWMTQEDLDECAKAALALFTRGQEIAASRGLILVDTKYEFGKDGNKTIRLIDEIHTPDSSRYWLASSVEERIQNGLEPENIDKEFLRLWFRERCDPYDPNVVLPEAPRELVLELSKRYIQLYEMITWQEFDFNSASHGEDVISEKIQSYLAA